MSKTKTDLPVKARDKATAHLPSPDPMCCNHKSISNHRLAERLAGSSLFRDFQRAFEAATALPLTLRAVESWQLAHTESRNQNGFCASDVPDQQLLRRMSANAAKRLRGCQWRALHVELRVRPA